MVALLVSLMALSTLLCACNKGATPSDNNDVPSSKVEEQTSTKIEEQSPADQKKQSIGVNPDWLKVYKCNDLSLQANKCSAIINSKEALDVFCNMDTSSCLKTATANSLFPNATEEQLNEKADLINYYVNCINEANQVVVDKLQKKYDAQFFEGKSLVVLFARRPSSMLVYPYKDHEVNGNALNITLAMKLHEDYRLSCDMETFFYIMEFDKDAVDGVEQVSFNEIIEYV